MSNTINTDDAALDAASDKQSSQHYTYGVFMSRLDRIEELLAHQSGISESLKTDVSMTHTLFQDLTHQVDRISERLESPCWNATSAAPFTPVKDSTLPPAKTAPMSPLVELHRSIQSGGASPKPADVPYGTPNPEGAWYGVKTGLNGCKLVTNCWSVCESVVKDKQTKKPLRGADWHKFPTAAEAYDYIEAC